MFPILFILLYFIFSENIFAQETSNKNAVEKNLVPNGSFEKLKISPIDYGEIEGAEGWEKNYFTPDLFCADAQSDKIQTPYNFFGHQIPSEGKNYAGILAYHTKSPLEIISIRLTSPVRKGHKYKISLKASLAEEYSNFACDNLGMLFSNDTKESYHAQMAHAKFINPVTDTQNWVTLEKTIIPTENFSYLFIGNFFPIERTKAVRRQKGGYEGAYYYVDDIQVIPLDEETPDEDEFVQIKGKIISGIDAQPLQARIDYVLTDVNHRAFEFTERENSDKKPKGMYEFSRMQYTNKFYLEAKAQGYFSQRILMELKPNQKVVEQNFVLQPSNLGAILILPNIEFEIGKAIIGKNSFSELDMISQFLQEHPNYHVEISGHTDNTGDSNANLQLSKDRAKAITQYVVEHGFIKKSRISHTGFGQTKPIASNDTEQNRHKNRRVEIKIVKD
jgi:outer membrane protein OmpA-like peptidoglycan-associated protein